MLEALLFKELKEKRYLLVFVLSVIISILAIVITNQFLPFNRGMEVVFVVSLGLAYPLIRYLIREDAEEEHLAEKYDRSKFYQRHLEEVTVYMSMFLGVFLVIVTSTFFIDPTFYQVQMEKICEIRQDCTITGNASAMNSFVEIVTNNISVFIVTFLMSFILAAGMIFILVWNASVFGVFIGSILSHSVLISLSYLPHGLLEIA